MQFELDVDKVICGDAIDVLKTFPSDVFDCCITSPPYYNQRNYNSDKQIGNENSVESYVIALKNVFDEVKRVMKPTGTLWLNLGDSYDKWKNLYLAPHRVALALQGSDWILRSDIVYAKRNCMPSSVQDRPVSSKEYVFLFVKSKSYFYDWKAIATEPSDSYKKDKRPPRVLRQKIGNESKYYEGCDSFISQQFKKQDNVGRSDYTGFNDRYVPVTEVRRRDVWSLSVPGNKEKHFAIFNKKLVDLCMKAGCPEGGLVLDPFGGIGTVGAMAKESGRNYVCIDINPEYCNIANEKINNISR